MGVKSLKLFEILTPIRHRVETWTDSIQELLRNISSGVEKRLQNSYLYAEWDIEAIAHGI